MSKFDVVILGGGIHGASLAYFLSKKGVTTLIIERSSVAAAGTYTLVYGFCSLSYMRLVDIKHLAKAGDFSQKIGETDKPQNFMSSHSSFTRNLLKTCS